MNQLKQCQRWSNKQSKILDSSLTELLCEHEGHDAETSRKLGALPIIPKSNSYR